MNDYNSPFHTKWEFKYHIVFIPKYRRKTLFGVIKKHLGVIFHELARQKKCVIEKGHLMPDHVYILISIPPKYKVSEVVIFIKGKSAIQIARQFMNREKTLQATIFWLVVTLSQEIFLGKKQDFF